MPKFRGSAKGKSGYLIFAGRYARHLDERALTLPRVRKSAASGTGLDRDERRVLAFLENHAKRDLGSERVKLLERSIAAARRKARESKALRRTG